MAIETDITCKKGETRTLVCTVEPTTNIAGWTVSLTVRHLRPPENSDPLVSKPATLTNPTGGVFAVILTSADTKDALGVGVFAYDLFRTDAGNEAVLGFGTLKIAPSVLYP